MYPIRTIILLIFCHFLLFPSNKVSGDSFSSDGVVSIPAMQVVYHHEFEQTPLHVTSMMKQEIGRILSEIHQLSGLNSLQLPTTYYQVHFPTPVVLSPFSPVGHPIQELIITPPLHAWDEYHLYIRNRQGQWIEYRTHRTLSIIVNQLAAWNTIQIQ